jgi:hypothetical protein
MSLAYKLIRWLTISLYYKPPYYLCQEFCHSGARYLQPGQKFKGRFKHRMLLHYALVVDYKRSEGVMNEAPTCFSQNIRDTVSLKSSGGKLIS